MYAIAQQVPVNDGRPSGAIVYRSTSLIQYSAPWMCAFHPHVHPTLIHGMDGV